MSTNQTNGLGEIIRAKIRPEDLSDEFLVALKDLRRWKTGGLHTAPQTQADLLLAAALRFHHFYGLDAIMHRREAWPYDWRKFNWLERATTTGKNMHLLLAAWGQAQELLQEIRDKDGQEKVVERVERSLNELHEIFMECEEVIERGREPARGVGEPTLLEELAFGSGGSAERRER